MLHTTQIAGAGSPYVVVIGNEKGGSGKTTLAMHLAVALLKEGQRVGTIDLDSNQRGLTRYIENRRIWANHRRIELEMPLHHLVLRAEGAKLRDNEAEEMAAFERIISGIRKSVDFLVIDESNPSSIVSSIGAARRNAREERNNITVDVWESLNGLWLELSARLRGNRASLDRGAVIEAVKKQAVMIFGAAQVTLLRDEAYNFFQPSSSAATTPPGSST